MLSNQNNYKTLLKEKITNMFNSSIFIKKSIVKDTFIFNGNIKFLIKFLEVDEIEKKQIFIDKKEYSDVFEPPFEEGMLIEDDFLELKTHRLLFNKFPVMDYHVILATRQFVSQYTHLDLNDVKACTKLADSIDGVVFFNGGKNAGASQPRKHMQGIPLSSMYEGEFGLIQIILDKSNIIEVDEFHKIKQFEEAAINHLLIYLPQKQAEFPTEEIYELYIKALNKLELANEEKEENIEKAYSLLFCKNWMLIVPRKTDEVYLAGKKLNLNSVGLLLTILVKNERLIEELKRIDILKDIISKL